MHLVYICDRCQKFIGEIDMGYIDETRLGFNILTPEEKDELLFFDWDRRMGTVKAICDDCWLKINSGHSSNDPDTVVH